MRKIRIRNTDLGDGSNDSPGKGILIVSDLLIGQQLMGLLCMGETVHPHTRTHESGVTDCLLRCSPSLGTRVQGEMSGEEKLVRLSSKRGDGRKGMNMHKFLHSLI